MPFTLIEPERRPTRPSTDLSVEVRPAPLRPSSVTTSPFCTVRFTPCSTCDSPYHAWRLSMRRTSLAMPSASGASSFSRSHVLLDHRGARGDDRVRAFGEHRAAREHGDHVADAGDDAHVVLHHQHRAPDGDFLDEVAHAVDVLVPHARRGLVEEHELGLHGERRRDLQRALAAVGELARVDARELREAYALEQRHGAVVEL